jgi:hypothetical protein
MQLRNLLTCLVVTLIVFTLVPGVVSAQEMWTAKITKTVAPDTVVAGQPLTVSVTTSYSMNPAAGQSLFVAIEDQSEIVGKPFPATANSCPSRTYSNESICIYAPTNSKLWVGDFTVSFTLTAPNYATTWNLYVIAQLVQLAVSPGWGVTRASYTILHVVVTASQVQSTTSLAATPPKEANALSVLILIALIPSVVARIVYKKKGIIYRDRN